MLSLCVVGSGEWFLGQAKAKATTPQRVHWISWELDRLTATLQTRLTDVRHSMISTS